MFTTNAMVWHRYESRRIMGMIPGGAREIYGVSTSSTHCIITILSIHAFSYVL